MARPRRRRDLPQSFVVRTKWFSRSGPRPSVRCVHTFVLTLNNGVEGAAAPPRPDPRRTEHGGLTVKSIFFHLMPYRDLPADFETRYESIWVTPPNTELCDPQ